MKSNTNFYTLTLQLHVIFELIGFKVNTFQTSNNNTIYENMKNSKWTSKIIWPHFTIGYR